MFVVYDKERQRIPIKIWLESEAQVEAGCMDQAMNLASLPFAYDHICLLPDTHQGYGMPIGGVLATEGVVLPNAVGVDIGCGMAYVQTNVSVKLLKEVDTGSGTLIQHIIGNILRNIPTGMNRHKEKQKCVCLDRNYDNENLLSEKHLVQEMENGYYQVGSLGSGNHFIEIQCDEEGMVGIMLHSGSRNFGKQICDHFNKIAIDLNEKWFSMVPKKAQLAFLPLNTKEGESYMEWMNLALDFAMENRQTMLWRVKELFANSVKKYASFTGLEFSCEVNAHHNYAAWENVGGKNVVVHRKGAIRVREDELGIIPGAMGSNSFIVRGKGCQDSFCTASHGAGRRFSRTEAKKQYSVQQVMEDLKNTDVVLGKNSKEDVAEECRMAYKDIAGVMEQQKDLVDIVKKLHTVGVVKG